MKIISDSMFRGALFTEEHYTEAFFEILKLHSQMRFERKFHREFDRRRRSSNINYIFRNLKEYITCLEINLVRCARAGSLWCQFDVGELVGD